MGFRSWLCSSCFSEGREVMRVTQRAWAVPGAGWPLTRTWAHETASEVSVCPRRPARTLTPWPQLPRSLWCGGGGQGDFLQARASLPQGLVPHSPSPSEAPSSSRLPPEEPQSVQEHRPVLPKVKIEGKHHEVSRHPLYSGFQFDKISDNIYSVATPPQSTHTTCSVLGCSCIYY